MEDSGMISFLYLSFVRERYTLPNSMQRIGTANKSSAYNEQAANVLGETPQRQSHLSYPEANTTACTLNLPADSDQCFCHKGYSLFYYLAVWKTTFKLPCSQESKTIIMLHAKHILFVRMAVTNNS